MIKKYIIVASEDINAALQDKITNYFQEKEMNIWHWITNVWLLIDDSGVSRNQIRDDLLKFVKATLRNAPALHRRNKRNGY